MSCSSSAWSRRCRTRTLRSPPSSAVVWSAIDRVIATRYPTYRTPNPRDVVEEGAGTLRAMTPPRPRSSASVARARMVGLGLWGAPAADPAAVVADLIAMQAQEHRYARWSVGQRCGAPTSVVDAAFDAGCFLR